MKHFICALLLSGVLCTWTKADIPSYQMLAADGFGWPKIISNQIFGPDKTPINLKDGERFRVIPLPHGGQGGPEWKIQREKKPGIWEDITDGIFGYGHLAEPHEGWVQLILMNKCGWREKRWALFRCNGSTYECVREEQYDYLLKKVKVSGELPHDPNSYRATLHRIEVALRLAVDMGDREDQYMEMIYPAPDFKQPMVCTFSSAGEFRISILPQARPEDIRVYGVANPMSGDNSLGIDCKFGEKINLELKERIKKALGGSFTLSISNQSPEKAGRYKFKTSGDGIDFEQEFTVDSEDDIRIFRFSRPPWYKFWRNCQSDFKTTKAERSWE